MDDDSAMLETTAFILERKGYLVTAAIGGEEATTKVKDMPDAFDVVLTDYSRPDINGIELAELIKESGGNVPVILVSGKFENIDKRQVAAIVIKPYSINELDEAIKKVINENGRHNHDRRLF